MATLPPTVSTRPVVRVPQVAGVVVEEAEDAADDQAAEVGPPVGVAREAEGEVEDQQDGDGRHREPAAHPHHEVGARGRP